MAQNLQTETFAQSVNSLMQALQIDDSSTRQQEIDEILKEVDKDKAVSLLFDAFLKSYNIETRKTIVKEIAKVGNKKAVEILESIASDDYDDEISRRAIEGLNQIGSEEAVDALLNLSSKSKLLVRDEVVSALGHFNSDKVVDYLIKATKDYFVADRAVSALWRIGSDRAIDGLIGAMQDIIHGTGLTAYNAMYALVQLGTNKALDGLFQAWNSPITIHRSRLIGIFFNYQPKHLIQPLCERLKNNPSPDIRKTSAEILGFIGTEEEIPFLKSRLLDDENDEVGWKARRAAEQIALAGFEKRKERERALEETRAFIAHEVRSAIGPLNAYAKMLDENLAQPELNKEKLSSLTQKIINQTKAAYDVVNQYVEYSQPLKPKFELFDINRLLEKVIEEIKAGCGKRNINIIRQFADNVEAEIDRQMLTQVFRNVINNALDSMEQGGKLSIATNLENEKVIISISDTGQGLKPEHLTRVFELGFTTKLGKQGAGVGLALARRQIEEAHRGSISIENNQEGKGATVTISLPTSQKDWKYVQENFATLDS